MSESTLINLLALDPDDMRAYMQELGEKPYRAVQLLKWIYHHGVVDFEQMSNISKKLRTILSQQACITLPELIKEQPSKDGTYKWLLQLNCKNSIETVFIPEKDRGTLCISSQVGCTLNCKFCSTATQGFNRNLAVEEIVGQILFATRRLGIPDNKGQKKITNIVLMGMGEPLVNFDNVMKAIHLMLDDNAFGLSKRRVTVSTAGMVPAIYQMAEQTDVSLAVSLHAPNNDLRSQIVPLNKKYSIEQLLPACRHYISSKPHRKITWEYVMLQDVNDSDSHAQQLAQLLKGIPSKINLIPFNRFPGTVYSCSTEQRMERFRNILIKAGFPAIIRKTRGDDIDAACGQLVGEFSDRTRRHQRLQNSHSVKSMLPEGKT